VALIRDPADPDVMRRPPRDPAEALITGRFAARMLGEGALLAAGVLSVYLWVVWNEGPGPRASTMAFTTLVLIHPLQASSCRSDRWSWWQLRPNWWVPLSLLALLGAQWVAVEPGPLARLLGTVALTPGDWLMLAAGVLWPVAVVEARKAWGRAFTPRPAVPTESAPVAPQPSPTSRND
jgi:Ca2+-transporting ATPase